MLLRVSLCFCVLWYFFLLHTFAICCFPLQVCLPVCECESLLAAPPTIAVTAETVYVAGSNYSHVRCSF